MARLMARSRSKVSFNRNSGGVGTLTLLNDPLTLANGSNTTFELFGGMPGV
jgi:hypothetical protein